MPKKLSFIFKNGFSVSQMKLFIHFQAYSFEKPSLQGKAGIESRFMYVTGSVEEGVWERVREREREGEKERKKESSLRTISI